jgi:hypothetical protein
MRNNRFNLDRSNSRLAPVTAYLTQITEWAENSRHNPGSNPEEFAMSVRNGQGLVVLTASRTGRMTPLSQQSRWPRGHAVEEATDATATAAATKPVTAAVGSNSIQNWPQTYGDLTLYRAMAPFCVVERQAELRKNRMYCEAIDQLGKDRDQVAFHRAFEAATALYRSTMQQAQQILAAAIGEETPMTVEEAAEFWALQGTLTARAG